MQFVDLTSDKDWLRLSTRGAVVMRWATSDRPTKFPIPAPEMNAAGFEKNIPYEDLPEGAVDVIDGYRNRSEVLAWDGYRSGVLAPWSNRIRDARFTIGGTQYDLGPDENGVREGLHGFTRDAYFGVTRISESFVELEAVIGDEPGYPWRVIVTVTYTLRDHVVEIDINAENISATPAPISLGLHPYFRYRGAQPDDATLFLPARERIAVNQALIPEPGDRAFVTPENGPGRVQPAQLVDEHGVELSGVLLTDLHNLDDAFTSLSYDPYGFTTAQLNQANGDKVLVKMYDPIHLMETDLSRSAAHTHARGEGVYHVFTGEPLGDRPTQAIAIETCQSMTDAFNREERNCLIEPGSSAHLEVEWEYRFAE